MDSQKTPSSQSSLEKGQNATGIALHDFKPHDIGIEIKHGIGKKQ